MILALQTVIHTEQCDPTRLTAGTVGVVWFLVLCFTFVILLFSELSLTFIRCEFIANIVTIQVP